MPDDQRRPNLTAVLGFLLLFPEAPELRLLHKWADAWSAVGCPARPCSMPSPRRPMSCSRKSENGSNRTWFSALALFGAVTSVGR